MYNVDKQAFAAPRSDGGATGGEIMGFRAWLCDLPVETVRTDAMQSFAKQETIFVELVTADGTVGTGYSYTIGTGGAAVLSMVRETLLPQLRGLDVRNAERIWTSCVAATRATMTGPLTALAIAAIDIAVWDAATKRSSTPLHAAAGGASSSVPLYDTEGGWLQLSTDELVGHAIASRERGFSGVKIKVGKNLAQDDFERLKAVREAVGPGIDIMIDANQCFTVAEAIRRAALFEPLGIYWFEEPLPADDVSGHSRLAHATSIPIAVGESIYSLGHFREYLQLGAASILQVDAARIGGITPWLKVAHLAEAFNVAVAPHFLMELHVSLACAISNSLYVEFIPQLRAITTSDFHISEGRATAPSTPGIGIDWDMDAVDALARDI